MQKTRTIGLIGGMSWESSAQYYRILNQGVRDRLGPTASARCLLWSFNFAEIEELQHKGDWDGLTAQMVDAAQRLEAAGAEVLLICTNTMHRSAPAVEAAVNIPLLHIADPTAERIKAGGFGKVGLLGTAFTMEHDFYKGRLEERYGLHAIVPSSEDRATVHRVIYEELVAGKILQSSRQAYRTIIARMVEAGAEAVILGCTEIMLLIGPEDSFVPLFDLDDQRHRGTLAFQIELRQFGRGEISEPRRRSLRRSSGAARPNAKRAGSRAELWMFVEPLEVRRAG